MRPRFSLALLAGVCALLFAGSVGAQSSVASDTAVTLRPGDVVRVNVWRNPEYSGEFPVGINGALRHPLYQSVRVIDMPLHNAEERLKEFLSKYVTDPQVVVEPLLRVTVGGEVRAPNLLSLPRSTTVSQAVALAGGPTNDGRLDKVKLIRGGQAVMLDLTSPNATWASAPVQSGDVVIVSKRSHFFRDVILPGASLVGSVASIVNLVRRN